MQYHRIDVSAEGKTYFRKHREAARYHDVVRVLGPDAAFSEPDDFFVVEQALVDGSLPDPSLEWEATGQWIAPYQWDMLIYMWSNADINRTSTSFSGVFAAKKYAGLNRDIPRQRTEQGRRLRELFTGLENAGLVEVVGKSPAGRITFRELKLAPVWLPDGPVPSGKARTWANLAAGDRNWFRMAMQPFKDPGIKRRRCDWGELRHIDRRALAALYLYFNDQEFGAVDPNHLCLRNEVLVMSEAFRQAVGRSADADSVAEALGEVWRRGLIGFMTARFTEDEPHPGAPAHIRFAERVAASEDVVVALRYVPRTDESGGADVRTA